LKRLLAAALLTISSIASAQYATLTGTIQSSNGLSASNYTITFTPSQFGFVVGTGVIINTTTYCGTSTNGAVVGIPNPTTSSVVTAAFTGTLPAGNYYVKYAWVGASATVTLASPESVVNLSSTGELVIPAPASGAPANAVSMNVYVSTSSGTETLQGSVTAGQTYLQNVALISGTALPSTNTTVCKQVANDAIWPVGTGYTVALVDPSGNTQPGYPMMWQLLGPNTTINLSNGLPYYHGVVTFPVPILASPLNNALQSIAGPLSLGTYSMGAGSYSVNGTPGFTGTKTAGSCTLTIVSGLITGVSGC
jgi:hypothetical protein